MIPIDSSIQRILAINFGGIGDEILFFPVIQGLRETYPNSRITMLVEPRCAGIGAFNPAIDEVMTFDIKAKPGPAELMALVGELRKRKFDLAISSGGSAMVPILLWLTGARYRAGYGASKTAGLLTYKAPLSKQQYAADMYYDLIRAWVPSPNRLPQVAIAPADWNWAKEFMAEQGVQPGEAVVMLHPGCSRLSVLKGFIKAWAPENWAELARRLAGEGVRVMIAGGPDDEETLAAIRAQMSAQAGTENSSGPTIGASGSTIGASGSTIIDAAGKTKGLGQLAALIEQASVLVAVDSAPLHLGVAVAKPTVAIFGPTDPKKLLPEGTIHQAVHVSGLECRPCLWDRRQTTCEALTCLKDLSVDMVEQAVRRVLPAKRTGPVDSTPH
ncbi:Lipopolysaccharide core heptosyltransferase RfaQ [compost metagenome]